MLWKIEGFDLSRGQEVELLIEAATQAMAERLALDSSVVISSTRPEELSREQPAPLKLAEPEDDRFDCAMRHVL